MLTIKRLDINDAQAVIAGAREKATEIGVPMCIAVTDESGHLIAFERMDGAKITSVNLAIDKSFTATGIQKSTRALGEVNQPGQPAFGISSSLAGRMIAIGGGVPVIIDGAVVGGIGVSSGSPTQDHDVAQAGVDKFNKSHT